ncbi:tail fiber domain-containing protein [Butyribacter intestini]|uniref:tail fiber domain-containing protein n=1 Tax=Butyribacter intestini TaxID=1703332 RepID=UPI0022DF6E6E|nr:tail fiber domain-containing protein [Butyribacter intestini]
MLELTDKEKSCFYKNGSFFNDYEFDFKELGYTITNDTLYQETVTIKESICDSDDLVLGGCIASSCEFEVAEVAGRELAGLEFTARLLVNSGEDVIVPIGKYRVDSAKRVDDKDYRKIVAYDALYDAQIDVSEWYNKVFYVVSQYEELITVGDIDDLWEHGDYYIDNSGSKPPTFKYFLNGAVPEELRDTTYLDTVTGKLYEAQNTSGDEDNKVYRWIGVYQCRRKTQTKYIYATTTLKKLRESLLNYLNIPFVEQDIINDDITISRTIDTNENGELLGTDMLKYICEVNAGFGKMNREGKFEVISLLSPGLYPEETLYPSEELYPEDHYEPIASDENSASYISTSYEEYEVEGITGVIIKGDSDNVGELAGTKDNPYVISGNPLLYGSTAEKLKEIGQKIYEQIKGYIYRPNTTTLDGLPYLETGDYFVLIKENSDDIGSFIFSRTLSGVQALKDTYESKGNKLRVNEDVQTSELMYLQSRTAKIQKSVDGVSIELANLDENTSSRFEQTASKIEAEVKRANNAEGELSGRITVTAGEITQEVTRAKGAEETLSGRITVTAGEITQEVTRATSEENTLRASISLKIDKDDDGQIISMINGSADVITLNSNRLIVNSTNFTLDRNGAGSIGGWQFGKGYMYSDGDAFISTHSRTNYYNWDGFPYKASIMQGKLICGIQSGALDEAVPDTTRGYCDFSVAGIFAKDKKMSNGYLFAVGVENGVVTTNTGAFTASDRRLKTNITEIDEQYANNLIDGLKPSTYTMIDGKRTHSGFIADEVKMTAEKVLGTVDDFAAYATVQIDEDKKDYAALRYEEFIAPLTKYCQCLKRDLKQEIERNQQLQVQLLNLQGEFMILKQQILGGN